jgi:transposase InsO family protein
LTPRTAPTADELFRTLFYDKQGNSTWTTVTRKKSRHKPHSQTQSTAHHATHKQATTSSTTRAKIHNTSTTTTTNIDITQFHGIMGHVNERYLRQTADYYNIALYSTLSTCIHCALANIGKAPISKIHKQRSRILGQRIFIDISKLSTPSIGGSTHWMLIVDDCSDYTWSYFLKHKSDTTTVLHNFISQMRNIQHPVQIIRCDNSGENQRLATDLKSSGSAIKFEFTAPATPQQNGRVEQKFAILYRYMRSFLNQAKLPDNLRHKLWAEAASHSTDIINSLCTPFNPIPPFKKFYNVNPPFLKHLRTFGEITVIVKHDKSFQSKITNKGLLGIYLGRAKDHPQDTARFYNIGTNKVILSRNMKYMEIMYGDYFNSTPKNNNNPFQPLYDNDDNDDEMINNETYEAILSNVNPPDFVENKHKNTTPIIEETNENDDEEKSNLLMTPIGMRCQN